MEKETYQTDVLVIGSGGAGCRAAIEAKKHGKDVIIVSKGLSYKSGAPPWQKEVTMQPLPTWMQMTVYKPIWRTPSREGPTSTTRNWPVYWWKKHPTD
jgi:flavin-dependent dehydrogenase